MIRIIGIDPGLRNTGWGIIGQEGSRLTYVADGALHSDGDKPLAERLLQLHSQLMDVLREYEPDEAAVEETFVNTDARATLKLGQARGVLMLVPAMLKLLNSADSADALAVAICHAHYRGSQRLADVLARS